MKSKASVVLSKARSVIVLRLVWFAGMLLGMPMVEDGSIETMSTDGSRIRYNPDFVLKLTMDLVKFVLCHEVAHCALGHHLRRGNRDPYLWNIACDHAVNLIMKYMTDRQRNPLFIIPDWCYCEERFKGKSAEQVYGLLVAAGHSKENPPPKQDGSSPQGGQGQGQGQSQSPQSPPKQGQGQGQPQAQGKPTQPQSGQAPNQKPQGKGQGQGQGTPQPGQAGGKGSQAAPDPGGCGGVEDYKSPVTGRAASEQEKRTELQRWRQKVQTAAAVAKQAGFGTAGIEAILSEIFQPTINFTTYIIDWLDEIGANEYDWTEGDEDAKRRGLYAPSLQSPELGPIVVVCDSSGSMDKEALCEVVSETIGFMEQFEVEVLLLWADTQVHKPQSFSSDDLPLKPEQFEIQGRGGTTFDIAFEYVEEHDIEPSGLLYMTDGYANKYAKEPDYPVLWVLTSDGKKTDQFQKEVPYGEVVKIIK